MFLVQIFHLLQIVRVFPANYLLDFGSQNRETKTKNQVQPKSKINSKSEQVIVKIIEGSFGDCSRTRFAARCLSLLKPYKGFLHNTEGVLRIAKDFEHT